MFLCLTQALTSSFSYMYFSFPMTQQHPPSPSGPWPAHIEALPSYTDTPHLVELLWTGDKPESDISP